MSGRYFAFVTGASRGFGKQVAQELVREIAPERPLDVLLTARSKSGLQSTADAIERVIRDLPHPKDVTIRQEVIDLEELDTLEKRLSDALQGIDPGRYSRALLINNAGSFPYVGPVDKRSSLASLRTEVDLNVTSTFWVTSYFARIFGEPQPCTEGKASEGDHEGYEGRESEHGERDGSPTTPANNVVVNVSSLAALKPGGLMATYCAGKAARDMFHSSFALEQGGMKVLNYSPGPMDTEMTKPIREQVLGFGRNTMVDIKESAHRCVRLAIGGAFPTGAHIDFYDQEAVDCSTSRDDAISQDGLPPTGS